MNKKIMKTIMVFLSTTISSMMIPVIGQFYEQQTGIHPIGFYIICSMGGMGIAIVLLFNIWENNL
jgi:hypothetical protein